MWCRRPSWNYMSRCNPRVSSFPIRNQRPPICACAPLQKEENPPLFHPSELTNSAKRIDPDGSAHNPNEGQCALRHPKPARMCPADRRTAADQSGVPSLVYWISKFIQ